MFLWNVFVNFHNLRYRSKDMNLEKVLVKEYVKLQTISELFEYAVKNYADKPLFCYKRKQNLIEKTYSQVWEEIQNFSGRLIKEGYTGKKIALVGSASYEWLITFFAVMNAGAVTVTLDKELDDQTLLERMNAVDVSAMFYGSSHTSLMELCKDKFKCTELSEVSEYTSQKENLKCETKPDDMALICFTSGTTSSSKGVMLSHKNIVSNSICGASTKGFTDNGKLLAILPLNHSFAVAQLMAAIYAGSAIAINESMKYLLPDMKYYNPTLMLVVPLVVDSIYRRINSQLKAKNKIKTVNVMRKVCRALNTVGIDIRDKVFHEIKSVFGENLNTLICGGAYLDPEIILFFKDIGINILQGYGITECSPVVAVNTDKKQNIQSVGYIMPYNKVRIVNGEVQVKGDNVMLGYYNDEESTKAAFDGGWFKTGDLGSVDDEGFLYITGRLKNLIILSNGENIVPEELELLIQRIPLVSEVIVKESEGKLCAEIFLDPESELSEAEKEVQVREEIKKLNKKLPTHHSIQKVEFRKTEFEKNSSKKIKRNYNK